VRLLKAGTLLALLGLAMQPVLLHAANCTVSSVGVNFATYNPLAGTPDDSTGQVSITCTMVGNGKPESVAYSIELGMGNASSYSPRRLVSGSNALLYNLFRDAGRSQVWGNGLGSTYTVTDSVLVGPGVGNGTRSNTYTIYGRVPAGQDPDPGSYSDTIVITLSF
jgi:spore coat protein U-like protein